MTTLSDRKVVSSERTPTNAGADAAYLKIAPTQLHIINPPCRTGEEFEAGTTDWSHGLQGGDPAAEHIMNILDTLSK